MGEDLEWYKLEVCARRGHVHAPEKLLDCLLTTLAQLKGAHNPGPSK